jgi:tRNA-dihydrouridine synthase A
MLGSSESKKMINRILSIAPMMGYTDCYYRYFMRLMTKRTLLYTEMLTTGAILRGDRDYLLRYDPLEHPLALQVGGSSPQDLAATALIASQYGYDEINLNVGCPSERVQSGRFGACLMAEPELVAACVSAMREVADIPVTVKTRIGIDQQESQEFFYHFIETVANAGCKTFIIHARKAWLNGLSPKENREIPPLRYDVVLQLKRDFPELEIIINGGIKTIPAIEDHLKQFDGVMIGREAYHNPFLFVEADRFFDRDETKLDSQNEKNNTCEKQEKFAPSRAMILKGVAEYIENGRVEGRFSKPTARHLMGLFQGQPRAREWRRFLSEEWLANATGSALLDRASELNFI